VPLSPGKREALREFVKEVEGPKVRETEAANQRLRIHKVGWFLQATPTGDLLLYYSEDENHDMNGVAKTMALYAISKDPFDVWFKEKFKEVTGVDLNKPLPGPPPKELRFREYIYEFSCPRSCRPFLDSLAAELATFAESRLQA
jgi:hypothetical protein